MQHVLITGGAGYIGSHAALAFLESGRKVVVLDDLSSGRRDNVPDDAAFVEGNVADCGLVSGLFERYRVCAVVHFAGSVVVSESVSDPLKYYGNNTCASRSLIGSCILRGINRFVFSSTAAVYGDTRTLPVTEATEPAPVSPYGASKAMTEAILADTGKAHDFRYVALRYFNVAGADPLGRTGQTSRDATHLIKIACETALGKRPHMEIYGEDYATTDGTCIRDFIHVSDIAAAHVSALEYLDNGGESRILNCGYGRGISVREVLEAVEKISNKKIDVRAAARRPGDVQELIADVTEIGKYLRWSPRHSALDTIIRTAFDWEKQL